MYRTPALQNGNFKKPIEWAYDESSDVKSLLVTMHLGDLKLSLKGRVPSVKNPYSIVNSMCDVPCAAYALELFLALQLQINMCTNNLDPGLP